MINLTPEAINEVKRLGQQRHHNLTQEKLRIGIQSGCCAEFAYALSFDSRVNDADVQVDCGDIAVVLSAADRQVLQGLTIDYSEDLMGGAFRFLNPNATKTCDCGNTFSTEPLDPALALEKG